MNSNGPVQIDDLKAIIIGRKKFEELVKIINPTSDLYNENISFNNNNNFSLGNNQMGFMTAPFGSIQNTESDNQRHTENEQSNQNAPQQQPTNPFATASQADPFASQNNNNASTSNQNPFNNQRPFQNNNNNANTDPFNSNAMEQQNTQESKNDPFASKPNPPSSDPFARTTNVQPNQPDDADPKSKSKSKAKPGKKEKPNPFSVRKKPQ